MEEEELIKKNSEPEKGSPAVLFLALLELGAIFACVVILLNSGDDCENPIRTWIKVSASVLGFHGVFLVFFHKFQGKLSGLVAAINSVILSFLFLWMLTGLSWIYFDDECKDDFENGYYLVLALFGVYFGMIGLTLLILAGVVCLVCIGGLYINSLITMTDEEVN